MAISTMKMLKKMRLATPTAKSWSLLRKMVLRSYRNSVIMVRRVMKI